MLSRNVIGVNAGLMITVESNGHFGLNKNHERKRCKSGFLHDVVNECVGK